MNKTKDIDDILLRGMSRVLAPRREFGRTTLSERPRFLIITKKRSGQYRDRQNLSGDWRRVGTQINDAMLKLRELSN